LLCKGLPVSVPITDICRWEIEHYGIRDTSLKHLDDAEYTRDDPDQVPSCCWIITVLYPLWSNHATRANQLWSFGGGLAKSIDFAPSAAANAANGFLDNYGPLVAGLWSPFGERA
jgi:hypothetical protein